MSSRPTLDPPPPTPPSLCTGFLSVSVLQVDLELMTLVDPTPHLHVYVYEFVESIL